MSTKEQVDILPDMAAALGQLGRGSLTARIIKLEEALDEACQALCGIGQDESTWQGQEARAALTLIRHLQAKGRAF